MTIIAQTPAVTSAILPEEEDLFVDLHKDEQVLKYLPHRSEDEYRKLFALAIQGKRTKNGLKPLGDF